MIRLAAITTTLLVSSGLLCGVASAVPISFFGEDINGASSPEITRVLQHPGADAARLSFIGQLDQTVGTETFESFADGTGVPLTLTFPGAGSATLNGTGFVNEIPLGGGPGGIDTNAAGRYPISGDKYWDSREQFSIAFSSDVAAFGFYGIDFGDFGGQVTLDLIRRAGDGTCTGGRTGVSIPHSIDGLAIGGSVLYFGVIDRTQPFCGVAFGNTQPGFDIFGFDDMTIASLQQTEEPPPTNPVPSPGSLLLVAGAAFIGLAGLAGRTAR